MNFIRLLPVFISFLFLGAHFQRYGLWPPALLSVLAPGLLYFTRPWAVRIIQLLLILGTCEWIRTVIILSQMRLNHDLPWARLVIILGCVTIWTIASTLIFKHRKIRQKYGLINSVL